MQRIPPSEQIRKQLDDLLNNGLVGQENPIGTLVQLGAQLVVQELLERETRKFPQKVVPLEAVFIVILFCKCTRSPHPQEGDIVAVVVGLWIVWAGTLFVAVHTIHSLAPVHFSPFDRACWIYVKGGTQPIEECRRSVL
jgi:hypothetical protein